MKQISKYPPQYAALIPALLAVSACSPTDFSAGAPSEHVAQSYETIASNAAVTSTLGGAELLVELDPAGATFASIGTTAVSGSVTHDTGRLELNDGTYLFVDADGPDGVGNVSGAFGDGVVGSVFTTDISGYEYVMPYRLTYVTDGKSYASAGVAGMITSYADMPSAGSASYTGVALAVFSHSAEADFGADVYLDDGISNVNVDFASGTATVNLGNFARITDGIGVEITAAAAALDQIQGSGLIISGGNFSGGTWVTLHGGSVVNLVGASPTSTSNGTFFGYDASISAPDEVGGLVLVDGATAVVYGLYVAD